MIYPWQKESWQKISKIFMFWPHALLLYGQQGIGRFKFASYIAQFLLCESKNMFYPCEQCTACYWFTQNCHPDFLLVIPDSMKKIVNLNQNLETVEEVVSSTRITNTFDYYQDINQITSMEIKLEQIQSIINFCTLSSHRNQAHVILIYPASMLNKIAANALLKILEEPNNNTFFLLICENPEQLLPTINSRCQRWFLNIPNHSLAIEWLRKKGILKPELKLMMYAGSPLLAINCQSEENQLLLLIEQLSKGSNCDILKCSELFSKKIFNSVLYSCIQRWSYDLLIFNLTGTIRYFIEYGKILAALSKKLDIQSLSDFLSKITHQRNFNINNTVNVHLHIEVVCLEYRSLFTY